MLNSYITIIILAFLALFAVGCGSDGGSSSSPKPEPDASVEPDTSEEPDAGDADECTHGTLDCACNDGACESGLNCQNDVCVTEGNGDTGTVVDGNSAVRACDLLIVQSAGTLLRGATFGSGGKGVVKYRNPNVAISMAREGDTAFPSPAAELQVEGPAAGLELKTIKCFDSAGAAVDAPDVTLVR